MMTNKEKTVLLLHYLDDILPIAKCELDYTKPYELVIAVMLSAQTTDKAVNKVTSKLFRNFDTLDKFANAKVNDIEEIIHSLGMSKVKSQNIVSLSNILIKQYNGVVPSCKDELIKLPGIGNKSAGVVRAEVFKIPDLPVDTHILRISKRLGFAKDNANPLDTERILKNLIHEERWIKAHHQLIHFGRYHCLAKNPKCDNCKLKDICTYLSSK